MRTPPARAIATVALTVLTVAGCATGEASGRGPTAATPATVSAATYRAAVTAFLGCAHAHGYRVIGPVVSPLDQRMLLRDVIPPDDGKPAEYNARLAACEQKVNLPNLEPAFLEAHPPALHPRLRDDAVACLRRQGVSPRGDELNYGDYVRQSPVSADFGQCLTAAARETFPGMPSRITVFY